MRGFFVVFTLFLSNTVFAAYEFNLRQGVTPVSRDIYDLHMIIFFICVLIGLVVFSIMFYSIFKHRKSKGAVASNFHESTSIEILWTAIPVIILIAMAIPATKSLIALENTDGSEMNIKITGYQWKWRYDYPEEGISFVSNLAQSSRDAINSDKKPEHYLLEVDNRLVLPVNTRIRFLMTSADVIHNWWVPDFGVKQDANPGFINDAWAYIEKEGTYRGQCAELCGKDHGFMPIVVDVVSKAEYKQWVADKKAEAQAAAASGNREWTKEELMANGEKVYNANCAACHQVSGKGLPPAFPAMIGSKVSNDPDPTEHINLVLHGKAAMPAFKALLNDADAASVITYERQGFGNNGSIVQPTDVKSRR